MILKWMTGMTQPRRMYNGTDKTLPEHRTISTPKRVTLYLRTRVSDPSVHKDSTGLRIGETVRTGQKISFSEEADSYVISTVTGTVSSLSTHIGDFGKSYVAISIETAEEEVFDQHFKTLVQHPALDIAKDFLSCVPGKPPFRLFSDPENSIQTIVISGVDSDVFISTNRYVVTNHLKAVKTGIRILKQITGVDRIILAIPPDVMHGYAGIDAEVKAVNPQYPATLPQMMIPDLLGRVVPAGKTVEEIGISFFSAEAAASIGTAFDEGRIPVSKILTLIGKDGGTTLFSVRIGTPLRDLFTASQITAGNNDRIILGGPMTGAAIYSEDHPVLPQTDAVMVQDKNHLPDISDDPCINCGECVRICPAKIPIHMLVRYLEAGRYEEAADQYDLHSCIECGLCSFVCVSRMPIFQYIRLAKFELAQMKEAEANHA